MTLKKNLSNSTHLIYSKNTRNLYQNQEEIKEEPENSRNKEELKNSFTDYKQRSSKSKKSFKVFKIAKGANHETSKSFMIGGNNGQDVEFKRKEFDKSFNTHPVNQLPGFKVNLSIN